MRPHLLRAAVLASCLLAAFSAGRGPDTSHALQLLVNGDFETWAGGEPVAWTVGGTVTAVPATSGPGLAAGLAAGAQLRQTVNVSAGAGYSATISAMGTAGGPTARLTLQVLDAGFAVLTAIVVDGPGGGGPATLAVPVVAPPGAAFLAVRVEAVAGAGPGTVVFDAASVEETTPPPPPTPTPTPTPTATATPRATPRPGPAPAPPPPPPPPPRPQPGPPPGVPGVSPPAPTPGPAPESGFGVLLANGDFESVAGGQPLGWAKFGGDLAVSSAAYRGASAAALHSSTASLKWLHQVVRVEPGAWYEGQAWGRLAAGAGAVSIRFSWYASADGGGTAMETSDGTESASAEWARLAIGPVQAPAGAQSLRFRMLLRPNGPASAAFDDARLERVDAPPAPSVEPTATATPGGADTPSSTPAAATGSSPAVSRGPGGAVGRPAPGGGQGGAQPVGASGSLTLRLSEFLSDPDADGRDSDFEWVELVNIGTEPVDLAGWRIGDSGELDALPALVIPPGGYAIVAARSARFPEGTAVVRPADGVIGTGLNNAGDVIRLVAPSGEEVDAVSYGDNATIFDPPPLDPPAGASVGTVDARGDPDGANWRLTEAPSPGAPNRFPAQSVRPDGQPTVATPPGTGTSEVAPPPIDRAEGGSPATLLWAASGAIAALSAGASAMLLRKRWPALRERYTRGR